MAVVLNILPNTDICFYYHCRILFVFAFQGEIVIYQFTKSLYFDVAAVPHHIVYLTPTNEEIVEMERYYIKFYLPDPSNKIIKILNSILHEMHNELV